MFTWDVKRPQEVASIMRIYLSIIIPAYKAEKTIIRLLDTVIRSVSVNLGEIEVVAVDDLSPDKTLERAGKWSKTSVKRLGNFRIIALSENCGPAKARNIGVKYARGKVILFLDSDVELYKNTLSEIVSSFKNDPDLFALTGVWDKEQKTGKFFPKFKALRDWSYWINERDPRNYYYLFSTRIAAIDRKLFLRLGGFDTTYKAALIEDMELTYRIARRHAVVFNPKAMVKHEFEDFLPIAKKYFWRSYYWSRIYRERKKFDPVATTSKEAITTVSAAGMVFTGIILLVIYLIDLLTISNRQSAISNLSPLFIILHSLFILLFLIHLWGVRKFLGFTYKEEGLIFTLRSFFTGVILYLVILAGAGVSFISLIQSSKSQITSSK